MSDDDILVGMTVPPTAFRTSTKGKPSFLVDSPEEEAVYRAIVAASQQTMTLDDVRLMRRIFDRADLDGNRFVDREELQVALKTVDEGDLASRVLREILLDDQAAATTSTASSHATATTGSSPGSGHPPHAQKRRHAAERQVLRDSRWSFPAFVFLLRAKLSNDERLKLLTKEEEFLREMGVTSEERSSMEEFRQGREERRRSSLLHQFLKHHGGDEAAPPPLAGGESNSPSKRLQQPNELSDSETRRRSLGSGSLNRAPNDVEEYKREFGLV